MIQVVAHLGVEDREALAELDLWRQLCDCLLSLADDFWRNLIAQPAGERIFTQSRTSLTKQLEE